MIDPQTPPALRRESPLSPMAPLWMRSLSFGIDAMALAFACHLPWRLNPDAAMLLAPYAIWWQLGVAWLYFGLLNGPLGKGRTLGKLVTDTVTLGHDGKPLPLGKSFLRATAQLLPFGLALGLMGDGAPEPINPWSKLPGIIGPYLGMGLLAGNIAHIIAHPLRRGWHDRIAGDSSTPRQPVGSAYEELVASCDSMRLLIANRSLQMALLATAAVAGLGSCEFQRRVALSRNEDYRFIVESQQRAHVDGLAPILRMRRSEAPTEDGLTTATLVVQYEIRSPAPPSLANDAVAGARALVDMWLSEPERAQGLVFRGQENGVAKVMRDYQIQAAQVEVFEVYPLFNLYRSMKKSGEMVEFALRFPPDELLELAPPADGAPLKDSSLDDSPLDDSPLDEGATPGESQSQEDEEPAAEVSQPEAEEAGDAPDKPETDAAGADAAGA